MLGDQHFNFTDHAVDSTEDASLVVRIDQAFRETPQMFETLGMIETSVTTSVVLYTQGVSTIQREGTSVDDQYALHPD